MYDTCNLMYCDPLASKWIRLKITLKIFVFNNN